jgi:hypothetical protein
MQAVSRAAPHRKEIQAFQAECRGFETRLPLQTPFRAWRDTQPLRRERREGCSGVATTLGSSKSVSLLASALSGRLSGCHDARCDPDGQPAAGALSGWVTAITTRPSIPAKSFGLHV